MGRRRICFSPLAIAAALCLVAVPATHVLGTEAHSASSPTIARRTATSRDGCFRQSSAEILATGAEPQRRQLLHLLQRQRREQRLFQSVLDLRGGASRRGSKKGGRTASLHSSRGRSKSATGKPKVGGSSKKSKRDKESALSNTMTKYKSILPLTRLYITAVGLVTLLAMVLGDEAAQGLLALDPIRVVYGFEFWRPFTAATFLGPPSVGWLMSAYYLFEYGSNLERAYGTAQQIVFLNCQLIVLTILSALFGLPFFASSVITAMLHVLSRAMPNQKVKWLVFTVPYWSLPYGLMATDVLQAGSAVAALPHVLGILSGHYYYFFKFVWPKLGGEDWLEAPGWLSTRLDPNARENVSEAKATSRPSRKKGKGRKLGRN